MELSTESTKNKSLIEQLKATILEMVAAREPAYLAGSGCEITFQALMSGMDLDKIHITNPIRPSLIKQFMESKDFYLQCRMIRLQTTVLEAAGTHMLFKVQENSFIAETRLEERLIFASEENVTCEILNPYDGQTVLQKKVLDISPSGLSLRTQRPSQLFQQGTQFEKLKILIDGRVYTESSGRIVYCRQLMDLKNKLNVQVGIKLDPPEEKKV